MRTLLLHPILPPQGLSTSWTSIWKLADNKVFLPAVCCSFKPTLILRPPAESWLLEEDGSPWEELAKLAVKELVPSCLFSCLSQIAVEEGKPFPLPLNLPALFAATTLAEEMKGMQVKWLWLWNFLRTSSLAFFCRIFICLYTKVYPWHCFQTWNSLQFSREPFELLGQSFPSRTVIFFWLHFDCLSAFWALLETTFSWLVPFSSPAAGTENRYGQRLGSKMSCQSLSYMTRHGG